MIKSAKATLHNNNGSALVITLLILAAITVIGVSSLNISNVEILLAQNEKIYKKNFYSAEAAVMEGAQRLEDAPSDALKIKISGETYTGGNAQLAAEIAQLDWLLEEKKDMSDTDEWVSENYAEARIKNSKISTMIDRVSGGSSMDLANNTRNYEFSIYGLHQENGSALIEIGYKRRF